MPASRVDEILVSLKQGANETLTLAQQLCVACAEALSVSGVGMALMTQDGHGGVVAATDGPAKVMEDLQLGLGEGPCVDAFRGNRPVLQPDLARTAVARWPGFGPAVLEGGIAAIFAFPLQVGAIRLGVLDLYRSTSGDLDEEQLSHALAFADAAVAVLLHLQSKTGPDHAVHPQLSSPVENSPVIHQATGMITVQASTTLADALMLLQGRAYAAERSVVDMARAVVARQLRFAPEDDHHE